MECQVHLSKIWAKSSDAADASHECAGLNLGSAKTNQKTSQRIQFSAPEGIKFGKVPLEFSIGWNPPTAINHPPNHQFYG